MSGISTTYLLYFYERVYDPRRITCVEKRLHRGFQGFHCVVKTARARGFFASTSSIASCKRLAASSEGGGGAPPHTYVFVEHSVLVVEPSSLYFLHDGLIPKTSIIQETHKYIYWTRKCFFNSRTVYGNTGRLIIKKTLRATYHIW